MRTLLVDSPYPITVLSCVSEGEDPGYNIIVPMWCRNPLSGASAKLPITKSILFKINPIDELLSWQYAGRKFIPSDRREAVYGTGLKKPFDEVTDTEFVLSPLDLGQGQPAAKISTYWPVLNNWMCGI